MDIKQSSGYSSFAIRQLGDLRGSLDDLVRQLGSGRKAETYAGLGADRALSLSFRQKLASTETYQQAIDLIGVRLKVADQTITRMTNLVRDVKSAFDPNQFQLLSDGRTAQQTTARTGLQEFVDLLNTSVAGFRLFGGRATDKDPVGPVDEILYGTGNQAGFKQVMQERQQADLGPDLKGRLTVAQPTTSSVSLAEDGTHPFGFKLGGVTSTLTNAVVVPPAGTPPALSVDFSAGQPKSGDSLRLTMTLPDGSTDVIELHAGTVTDAAGGTFAIGATVDDTAANFASVLNQQLLDHAGTALKAASAVAASGDFFATAEGQPPMRVDGPPFDTATAQIAGTDLNTVGWYKGENTAAPGPGWSPRQDMTTKVDSAVEVRYGMRANEEAFSWNVRQMAILTVADVSGGTASDKAYYSELVDRLRTNLSPPPGVQSLANVGMELASANQVADQAAERHKLNAGTYTTFVEGVEGIDQNEVAAKLVALQTRMQASYQATSILYKMSLTDYM
jgi:flagellin-like hook-associated protein FlgL